MSSNENILADNIAHTQQYKKCICADQSNKCFAKDFVLSL